MTDAHRLKGSALFRIAVLAWFSLLPLVNASAAQTEDALFNMAKQTDSLQKYYGTRFDNPDLSPLFDIHMGLNTMEFGSYPVITEFGKAEYSIMVAYSYFRVDIRKGGPFDNKPFRFRGLDFSGKSVSLSKPFMVDGVGFSETRGQIGLQDMVLGLFTIMNIDFDAGFMRDRKIVSAFSDSSGTKTSGIEFIGDFFVGQTSDSYSFYIGTGSGRLIDLSLRVRDKVESFNPSLSVLYLLQKTGWATPPAYLADADLWVHYSPDETLAGANATLDYHVPVKLPESSSGKIKTTVNDVMGYKLDARTAFSITAGAIDDSRLELMLDYFGYYVKGGVSYMVDDRLVPFGAPGGSAFGYRVGGGYTAFHALDLCVLYSMNFSDHLEFLSGSYNHPTATFYFVFKF
jgi:hypothetical protein